MLQDFIRNSGYAYCRLDGSTNRVQRAIDISSFNTPGSPTFIFLMSTRAGGLGAALPFPDLPLCLSLTFHCLSLTFH